jgi:hypothetical protein
MTEADSAAPCRHVGAPRPETVERAGEIIRRLANHPDLLSQYGLTPDEFQAALPAAVESVRGSMSASNAGRREFLGGILNHLVAVGLATSVSAPTYGDDTVYRLEVPGVGTVAIIQKGCPDGAHSSVRWQVPVWADETYLWWLCPSMKANPGDHVAKGVNRLRKRFFSDTPGELSGVIFHNELCGSAQRPCPKIRNAVTIDGNLVPPPCIYTMPERESEATSWNWAGGRKLGFPAVLLKAFSLPSGETDLFAGYVGFQRKTNGAVRTTITTRYGAARSSTYRSKA